MRELKNLDMFFKVMLSFCLITLTEQKLWGDINKIETLYLPIIGGVMFTSMIFAPFIQSFFGLDKIKEKTLAIINTYVVSTILGLMAAMLILLTLKNIGGETIEWILKPVFGAKGYFITILLAFGSLCLSLLAVNGSGYASRKDKFEVMNTIFDQIPKELQIEIISLRLLDQYHIKALEIFELWLKEERAKNKKKFLSYCQEKNWNI